MKVERYTLQFLTKLHLKAMQFHLPIAIIMGSHSVTCHPTQVNTPWLNPN